MTIQRQALVLPASGVIETMLGNFCLLVTSNAAVNLRLVNGGSGERFDGVVGGLYLRRVKPWDNLQIIGAAGTSIEFWIGNEDTDEDVTDIRLQITTIAGVASFAEAPSATIATPARQTRATAGATTIAANLLRRRITIANPSDNATPGLLYVQASPAGAGRGIPLDTGLFVELKTTAAIDIRNDSGVTVDFTTFEET